MQLAAGLDGVAQKFACREPVNRNIFRMSYRDRRKYQIDDLPRDLHEIRGGAEAVRLPLEARQVDNVSRPGQGDEGAREEERRDQQEERAGVHAGDPTRQSRRYSRA